MQISFVLKDEKLFNANHFYVKGHVITLTIRPTVRTNIKNDRDYSRSSVMSSTLGRCFLYENSNSVNRMNSTNNNANIKT